MSIDINAGHLGLTAGYSALVYSKSYDERSNTAFQNAVNLFFTDSLPAAPEEEVSSSLDDAFEGIRNVVEAVRGFEQPTRDVINAVSDLFQN